MSLRCFNRDCGKVLNKKDFELLEDDDGDLFIFCVACGSLPWPMSTVVSSKDVQLISTPASLRV